MTEKKYLAFDFGAESGRAILGTLSSGKLSLEEKHRFANPMGKMRNRLQWDLLGQWEQIKQGLRKTTHVQLDGIGVDTWGVDFGLLDASGEVIGNPTMYRDSCTQGMIEDVNAVVGPATVYQTTGIQTMFFNTLYQLRALVKTRSPRLANASKLLFMPDLFNYLLTGVARGEFSIVSTSQMYDPVRKTWAKDLLAKLDIPTEILPSIIPTGTILGPLLQEVTEECEVSSAPVIATAGHDTASAVVSVPASTPNWCYISSGTWSLMGVELDRPIINDKSLRYNYTNEGGFGGTIRFLKNIMGMWLIQECRRHFIKEGKEYSYAELTQLASDAEPFAVLVDPDFAPFATPGDMPRKIDQFCERTGQPKPGSVGAYIRCCVDSLALKYRQTLQGLEDILTRSIDTIHIVGGGTQNELLNQLTADVCQRPVVTGPIEATAVGNILVQAIATGAIQDIAQARQVVRDSFPVKRYEPSRSDMESIYHRFLSYQK